MQNQLRFSHLLHSGSGFWYQQSGIKVPGLFWIAMFAYEYEVMRELRKKTKLILPINDMTADVFTQLFCLLLLTAYNYQNNKKLLGK